MLQLVRSLGALAFVAAAVTVAAAQPSTNARPISAATAPPAPPPPEIAPVASPSPTPAPPPENPEITRLVTRQFLDWQSGNVQRRALYTAYAGGTYKPSFVSTVSPDLMDIGNVQSTTYINGALLENELSYRYVITGSNGGVSVLYTIDQEGKIDNIEYTPLIFRAQGNTDAGPAVNVSPTPVPSPAPLPTSPQ